MRAMVESGDSELVVDRQAVGHSCCAGFERYQDAAFGWKGYSKERNRMSRIKTHDMLWSAGNDGC